MSYLTWDTLDYVALTESVRQPSCGAVVLFLGTVRDLTGDTVTLELQYEAYAPMAERQFAALEAELRTKWPIGGLAMLHRLGRLSVGEISVAVAVSCPHRAEAFAAGQYAMDRIKEIVPVWKRDIAPDQSSQWIHPEKPCPS